MRDEVLRHRVVNLFALFGPGYRMRVMLVHAGGGCNLRPQLRGFEPAMQVRAPDLAESHAFGPRALRVLHRVQRFDWRERPCLAHVDFVGKPLAVAATCRDLEQSLGGAELGFSREQSNVRYAASISGMARFIDE